MVLIVNVYWLVYSSQFSLYHPSCCLMLIHYKWWNIPVEVWVCRTAKLRKAKNKHFYWYQVHICWKIAKLVFKKKKNSKTGSLSDYLKQICEVSFVKIHNEVSLNRMIIWRKKWIFLVSCQMSATYVHSSPRTPLV